MLMIRLARVGATKQPYYRVVVIEKDRARNGRSIEVVGTYNPRTNPAAIELKRERIAYWTGNGAQLSDRVAKLMAVPPAAPKEATSPAEKVTAKPASTSAEPAAAVASTPTKIDSTAPATGDPEPVAAVAPAAAEPVAEATPAV